MEPRDKKNAGPACSTGQGEQSRQGDVGQTGMSNVGPGVVQNDINTGGQDLGAGISGSTGDSSQGQMEQGKEKVSKTVSRAREAFSSVAGQARQQAGRMGEKAREQGDQILSAQKSRVVNELDNFSAAIRCAADTLKEGQGEQIASYVHTLADQVDRACDYLERRDLNGLLRDLRGVARRRPELFLGGMFIAGLGLARIIKASGKAASEQMDYDRDWTGDYATSGEFSTVGQGNLAACPSGAADVAPETGVGAQNLGGTGSIGADI